MSERGLSGIVVFAYDRYSPPMYYVTGQRLVFGVYFRAADGRAHLVHDPMERDQAAAAGCDHSSFAHHRLNQLYDEEGSPARAFGRLIAQVCGSLGIDGAIGIYGDLPAGFAHALIARMQELAPQLVVDSGHPDLMAVARTTKESQEIRAIRHAARGAVAAIDRVIEFLGGLRMD